MGANRDSRRTSEYRNHDTGAQGHRVQHDTCLSMLFPKDSIVHSPLIAKQAGDERKLLISRTKISFESKLGSMT